MSLYVYVKKMKRRTRTLWRDEDQVRDRERDSPSDGEIFTLSTQQLQFNPTKSSRLGFRRSKAAIAALARSRGDTAGHAHHVRVTELVPERNRVAAYRWRHVHYRGDRYLQSCPLIHMNLQQCHSTVHPSARDTNIHSCKTNTIWLLLRLWKHV